MLWYQIFQDGPEYEARKRKSSFEPPNIALKDVRDAVPPELFERNTFISLFYVIRHVMIVVLFYHLATKIDAVAAFATTSLHYHGGLVTSLTGVWLRTVLWLLYAGWQGIALAGLWCLGHEAFPVLTWERLLTGGSWQPLPTRTRQLGVGSPDAQFRAGALLRLAIHPSYPSCAYSSLFLQDNIPIPILKSTNHLDREETHYPATRKTFNLPHGRVAVKMDYQEILEETPAFTLFKMFMRQFLHNRKGNPKYPKGTSHYKPSSMLFTPEQRASIIVSNISMCLMLSLLAVYTYLNGWSSLWCYYILPWLWANNWIVTFTYLQHSDPTIPYYRKDQWTFARGALSTVDRPVFGWVGRALLYNIGHDHVAHHLFSNIPFYNLPQATEAIKPVLGEYYNYDSTPTIPALWRSFTQCVFVEDEGQVVFFKNCEVFVSGTFIPAIPQIASDLSTTPEMVSLTISLSIFGAAIGSMAMATYSGFYGRRPIYLASLPFFCLGSYQIAVAQNIYSLIAWRFVQSVGISGGMSLGAGVIGDIYGLEERGFAMGVFYGVSLLGPAIAPVTGGIATHYSSWRMLQWAFLICGLALLMSMALWLPETSHPGSLGVEKTFDQDRSEPRFTLLRRKWGWVWLNPFSSLGLLRSPNLMLVGAKYGITNEALIGAVFIPCGLGNVVGAPLAGFISDRVVHAYRSKRRGEWYPEDRLRTTLIGAATCAPLSVLLVGATVTYVPGRTGLITCLGLLFVNGIGVDLVLCPSAAYNVDVVHTRSAEIMAANNGSRALLISLLVPLILPSITHFGVLATNAAAALIAWTGLALLALTIRYGEELRGWKDVGYSTVDSN
ncbi:hypothetical protein EYR40_000183 [Pleurotus pulmonarius]|nr:hypothetical protein EYR40_000183 [Pleurotus pulmonarius]